MTKRTSMFDPIAGPTKPGSRRRQSTPADDWTPITPVPEDAGEPDTRHRRYGVPSQVSRYTDEDGRLMMLVCRYDTGNGKEFIPHTFCRDADGRTSWRQKNLDAPRPLYNLLGLKQRPDALVLVVEGEKAADAAGKLFPDYVVVTSPGGSNAGDLADWSPLHERRVAFWRDNDKPGRKYQDAVVAALHEAGAASVRVVKVDPNWPDGFDLGDFGSRDKPQPEGLTEETIRQLVLDAEPAEPSAEASNVVPLPGRSRERRTFAALSFRKAQDGSLLFSSFSRDGKQDWKRSCSSITKMALTRSEEGKDWGVLVRVIDPDENHHEFLISQEALAGARSDEWRKMLARHGCMIEPGPEAGAAVHRYLMTTCDDGGNPLPRVIAATRIGWIGNGDRRIFVLPSETVSGDSSERAVYQPTTRTETAIGRRGSLENWRRNVGALCGEHASTAVAICLALTGPLLLPLGMHGFVLHFRGPSSTGKTTALRVAGSVWGGGPAGYHLSWQATASGYEAAAAAHNHTLLELDELGLAKADDVGAIAYQLADGIGRERDQDFGTATAKRNWRLPILSTGEVGLGDRLLESHTRQRQRAGQEVRFIDYPADTGSGFGIFDTAPELPDRPNATMQDRGAALSNSLRSATEADFGHLGPEFIRAIIHSDDWTRTANRVIDDFVSSVSAGTNGQVQRVARSFGLIAAAGELAISSGLLPWPEGRAITAAKVAFSRWLDARGHSGASEQYEAVNILRGVISKDAAKFQKLETVLVVKGKEEGNASTDISGRLGFKEDKGGRLLFLILKDGWDHIFAGRDPKRAVRQLSELGILVQGNRSMIQRKLPGFGKKLVRVYGVDVARLFDDSIIGGAGDG